MKALLSLAILSLAFAAAAQGPLRTIPADAKRAAMRHVQGMTMDVDGTQRALAPGAQIRDESNRVVLPTSMAASRDVKFMEDVDGRIRQVWILAPQEAQQSR